MSSQLVDATFLSLNEKKECCFDNSNSQHKADLRSSLCECPLFPIADIQSSTNALIVSNLNLTLSARPNLIINSLRPIFNGSQAESPCGEIVIRIVLEMPEYEDLQPGSEPEKRSGSLGNVIAGGILGWVLGGLV